MVEVIESATFRRWIRDLRDRVALARINVRLRNITIGNFGDVRAIGGISELRVTTGRGIASISCERARRSFCFAGATRTASNAILNAPDVWRRIGGSYA